MKQISNFKKTVIETFLNAYKITKSLWSQEFKLFQIPKPLEILGFFVTKDLEFKYHVSMELVISLIKYF